MQCYWLVNRQRLEREQKAAEAREAKRREIEEKQRKAVIAAQEKKYKEERERAQARYGDGLDPAERGLDWAREDAMAQWDSP